MLEGASKQSQHPKNLPRWDRAPRFIKSWIRHWYRYGHVIVAASPMETVIYFMLRSVLCSLILTLNLDLHCRQFHLVCTRGLFSSQFEDIAVSYLQRVLLPFGNFYDLAIFRVYLLLRGSCCLLETSMTLLYYRVYLLLHFVIAS